MDLWFVECESRSLHPSSYWRRWHQGGKTVLVKPLCVCVCVRVCGGLWLWGRQVEIVMNIWWVTQYAFDKSLSTLITLLTSPTPRLASHSSLSVVCVPSLPEQTGLWWSPLEEGGECVTHPQALPLLRCASLMKIWRVFPLLYALSANTRSQSVNSHVVSVPNDYRTDHSIVIKEVHFIVLNVHLQCTSNLKSIYKKQ